MAERITYGKTWWGQQWLQALTSIDEGNRLPRGKTYANKGAVRALKIETNQISAQVQGSKPRPYKTKLTVKLFEKAEKDALLAEIRQNPALLAQLLNRQLPPELIQFADQRGIRLFPRSFTELQAGCSCPDYAMPCKHLAAVIYLIANEIDQNPFLVFLLKGLDLLAELATENFGAGGMESVLTVTDLYTDDLPGSDDDEDWTPNEAARTELDFATIPTLSDSLLGLLEPEVTFTKSNFHKDLGKAYKLFSKPVVDKVVVSHPEPSDSLELQLDELLDLRKINIFSEHGEARPLPHFAIADLMGWLGDLTETDWPDMSDSVRALYLTRQFTAALLRRGAVVPQILRVGTEGNQYRVRWLPATLNETIRRLTDALATQLPPELLTVRWQKDIM
ncbi:MAG: helicase SNF2, partial [Cytophagaceae bacterium]